MEILNTIALIIASNVKLFVFILLILYLFGLTNWRLNIFIIVIAMSMSEIVDLFSDDRALVGWLQAVISWLMYGSFFILLIWKARKRQSIWD